MHRFTVVHALLLLLLAGHTASAAQPPARRAVRIAIVDDYPAFAPDITVRHPRAKPVAAVVHRIKPDGSEGPSIVLLNPQYATAETLAAALDRLGRCPAGAVEDHFVVAPGARFGGGARAVADAGALLRQVEAAPNTQIAGFRDFHGRFVEIPDLQVCRPPLGPRYIRGSQGPRSN